MTMPKVCLLDGVDDLRSHEQWWTAKKKTKPSPQQLSAMITRTAVTMSGAIGLNDGDSVTTSSSFASSQAVATADSILGYDAEEILQMTCYDLCQVQFVWPFIIQELQIQGYEINATSQVNGAQTTSGEGDYYFPNAGAGQSRQASTQKLPCPIDTKSQLGFISWLVKRLIIQPGEDVTKDMISGGAESCDIQEHLMATKNRHALIFDALIDLSRKMLILGYFEALEERKYDPSIPPLLVVLYTDKATSMSEFISEIGGEGENSNSSGTSTAMPSNNSKMESSIIQGESGLAVSVMPTKYPFHLTSCYDTKSKHYGLSTASSTVKVTPTSKAEEAGTVCPSNRTVGKAVVQKSAQLMRLLGIGKCIALSSTKYAGLVARTLNEEFKDIDFGLFLMDQYRLDWYNHTYSNPIIKITKPFVVGEVLSKAEQRAKSLGRPFDREEAKLSLIAMRASQQNRWKTTLGSFLEQVNALPKLSFQHFPSYKMNLKPGDLTDSYMTFPQPSRCLRQVSSVLREKQTGLGKSKTKTGTSK